MNPNIAFVGKAGSGKSTAADALMEIGPSYGRVAFADPLKDIAEQLWGTDARTDRGKLQGLGVAVREIEPDTWSDYWCRTVAQNMALNLPVVTDDLRFENEWWAAKSLGFAIVRVMADKATRIDRLRANGKLQDEAQLEHESEIAIDHLGADHLIWNNGSKMELAEQVVAILNLARR